MKETLMEAIDNLEWAKKEKDADFCAALQRAQNAIHEALDILDDLTVSVPLHVGEDAPSAYKMNGVY